MAEFDPNTIHSFAERLYQKAGTIVAKYALIGIVLGIFAGTSAKSLLLALTCALFFGAIGYSIGTEKAFLFKLQAQNALCQAKIEENTRNQGTPE